MAKALAEIVKTDPKAKDLEKAVAKACKSAALKDAADIAIFGRMVASDQSLTLEGAGLFSHALLTHRAENDIDFFSAVDDLQKAEEAGAGMTGTLEFTSAWRFAGSSLVFGFCSAWNEELRAVFPQLRQAVSVGADHTRKRVGVSDHRAQHPTSGTLSVSHRVARLSPSALTQGFKRPAPPRRVNALRLQGRDSAKEGPARRQLAVLPDRNAAWARSDP